MNLSKLKSRHNKSNFEFPPDPLKKRIVELKKDDSFNNLIHNVNSSYDFITPKLKLPNLKSYKQIPKISSKSKILNNQSYDFSPKSKKTQIFQLNYHPKIIYNIKNYNFESNKEKSEKKTRPKTDIDKPIIVKKSIISTIREVEPAKQTNSDLDLSDTNVFTRLSQMEKSIRSKSSNKSITSSKQLSFEKGSFGTPNDEFIKELKVVNEKYNKVIENETNELNKNMKLIKIDRKHINNYFKKSNNSKVTLNNVSQNINLFKKQNDFFKKNRTDPFANSLKSKGDKIQMKSRINIIDFSRIETEDHEQSNIKKVNNFLKLSNNQPKRDEVKIKYNNQDLNSSTMKIINF